jgi:hypothetical protein
MQPKTGQVHVAHRGSLVETGKNALDLGHMVRPHPPPVSLLEQELETLVAEADDHRAKCNLSPLSLQGYREKAWPSSPLVCRGMARFASRLGRPCALTRPGAAGRWMVISKRRRGTSAETV